MPQITSLDGLAPDRLITVGDVAAVLNINRSTAYDLIVSGKMGEFVRVTERTIRIEVRVVREYLAERRLPRPRAHVSFTRKRAG